MSSYSAADGGIRIDIWDSHSPAATHQDIESLAEVLQACVQAGASVSFVLPFSLEDGKAFWVDQILPGVHAGGRCLLMARAGERIVGTVQLDLATPPNQPHRAEVRKLLVAPGFRRQGVARALMLAAEAEAGRRGRSLLTLDTVTGGAAEALYRSLGYRVTGVIPDYAWNYDSTVLESTTVMYKTLL